MTAVTNTSDDFVLIGLERHRYVTAVATPAAAFTVRRTRIESEVESPAPRGQFPIRARRRNSTPSNRLPEARPV